MDAEIIHVSAIARSVLVFHSSLPYGQFTIMTVFSALERTVVVEIYRSASLEVTQIRWDHHVPEDLFWRAYVGGADGKSTVGIAF